MSIDIRKLNFVILLLMIRISCNIIKSRFTFASWKENEMVKL